MAGTDYSDPRWPDGYPGRCEGHSAPQAGSPEKVWRSRQPGGHTGGEPPRSPGCRLPMTEITLAPVDAARITILMDNVTDPLVFPTEHIERMTWLNHLAPGADRITSAVSDEGLPDALVAQPGFSALVRVRVGTRDHTILFDAGVTPRGVVENARRLDLSLADVETIVLSHGHWDHVAGMEGIAEVLGRRNLPVLIHPEFWNRRRIAIPGLEPAELPSTSRAALESVGFAIVEEQQPSFLLDGAVLVTGEVDRTTPFETGFMGHQALRGSSWEPDPLILDDQALVLRLADRGLVVLTGCGHAGIVNIVRQVQRLTGEKRIAAVIGGFHLSGPMFEPIIEPTVAAFDELAPGLLMPAHCTGWKAMHRLAARFPDAFVPSTVGTTIVL
jgi:7,8-dihydropterin-6-yl-methyl-4-(beta-D-ribofuranosyl)aminobenzene 5'-phosphate synthase